MKILVAYVPVLHRGYEEFFLRHRDADRLLLFGGGTLVKFDWLKKDLRCLSPERAVQAIRSWGIFPEVSLLDNILFDELREASSLVMPDETECRIFAETELAGFPVTFESVKLRYDKKKTESVDLIDAKEVSDDEALSLMKVVLSLKSNSPDWWLQVTAMAVRDGQILLTAWNNHQPSDREALFMGDPRSNYKRGLNFELSLADHAEATIVGEAGRHGIALLGSDLFVSAFPCPPCARLVRRAGFKRLFFLDGYAVLDGDSLLREAGIEILRVKREP